MGSNINKPSQLIDKIVYARFPYFDIETNKNSFKKRPMLLIGYENNQFPTDFTAFPISSISKKKNIHHEFDIDIGKLVCPNLKSISRDECYVRVHKPSTINSSDIERKSKYDDLYMNYSEKHEEIIAAWEKFNLSLFRRNIT